MKLKKSMIAAMLALPGVACSAPFLDDFETDTSVNYTQQSTYGGC